MNIDNIFYAHPAIHVYIEQTGRNTTNTIQINLLNFCEHTVVDSVVTATLLTGAGTIRETFLGSTRGVLVY